MQAARRLFGDTAHASVCGELCHDRAARHEIWAGIASRLEACGMLRKPIPGKKQRLHGSGRKLAPFDCGAVLGSANHVGCDAIRFSSELTRQHDFNVQPGPKPHGSRGLDESAADADILSLPDDGITGIGNEPNRDLKGDPPTPTVLHGDPPLLPLATRDAQDRGTIAPGSIRTNHNPKTIAAHPAGR
jgi:hypothetical protein